MSKVCENMGNELINFLVSKLELSFSIYYLLNTKYLAVQIYLAMSFNNENFR